MSILEIKVIHFKVNSLTKENRAFKNSPEQTCTGIIPENAQVISKDLRLNLAHYKIFSFINSHLTTVIQ